MRTLLFLFFSLFFLGEVSAQCSMCRAVLESGDAQETAKGINNGIIYLMAIPVSYTHLTLPTNREV